MEEIYVDGWDGFISFGRGVKGNTCIFFLN